MPLPLLLPLPRRSACGQGAEGLTWRAFVQVGVAFTRYQTAYFQGKYGNLDASVISYGPCQTPTLTFCVQRHQRIVSFQPEPFWVVRPSRLTLCPATCHAWPARMPRA